MTYTRITTQSGTVYEFDLLGRKVRRVPLDEYASMRQDEQWLDFEFGYPPAVGSSVVLMLEPLGEGDVTVRRTTPVVSIEGGD